MKTKKILIVDDEDDQILSLKNVMEAFSDKIEIIGAHNGTECFDYLKKERPALILLDIMIRGINGLQIHDQILNNPEWRSIPVVFLTGESDPVMKATGELIAEDYIIKPVRADALIKRIEKYL
ncbi:MAG: response regulator [Candidatus Thermoplasmatota archaeon]|nr:response regulator [Candidatus Thermoplasmatota archaeon]MBU1940985.1 response regulator [Candidatus Thermoplasmatota archaeon]